jgi:glycolate oxidase iron-sulfur subunit
VTVPHSHTRVGPSEEDLARCVHCGFCLQACPTYQVLSLETESPRGRIQLARAVSEGRVGITPSVVAHFDLCLQCRACETACPSGVPYGRIMEGARALVQAAPNRPRSWRLRSLALRLLFARPWRLRAAFSLLRIYQRSGVQRLLRPLLPRRLRALDSTLPRIPSRFFDQPTASVPTLPTRSVAMLTGCVMPLLYGRANEATLRVLLRNRCSVYAPPDQGCCGALHLHNGDQEAARVLARRNIDVFLSDAMVRNGVEAIIVNAAGCGSTMKEYGELLAGDAAYAERAARFSALVKDVSEFLAALPFEPPRGRIEASVTYQDSCHLAHAQGVRAAPRALLESIPGVALREMTTPDRCCGSAGIYNLTQPEMSRTLLGEKMTDALATQASIIATANPGCMLQLEAGVRQHGQSQEVLHVVELLDRAYAAEGPQPAI